MSDVMSTGRIYRLRAGSPMPIAGGNFVVHTFMAEESKVDVYMCTTSLPSSNEFRGQGGNLVSASFSRLETRDGDTFSGKVVHNPVFVEEGAIL